MLQNQLGNLDSSFDADQVFGKINKDKLGNRATEGEVETEQQMREITLTYLCPICGEYDCYQTYTIKRKVHMDSPLKDGEEIYADYYEEAGDVIINHGR